MHVHFMGSHSRLPSLSDIENITEDCLRSDGVGV